VWFLVGGGGGRRKEKSGTRFQTVCETEDKTIGKDTTAEELAEGLALNSIFTNGRKSGTAGKGGVLDTLNKIGAKRPQWGEEHLKKRIKKKEGGGSPPEDQVSNLDHGGLRERRGKEAFLGQGETQRQRGGKKGSRNT